MSMPLRRVFRCQYANMFVARVADTRFRWNLPRVDWRFDLFSIGSR
jgi:hypothetical protein